MIDTDLPHQTAHVVEWDQVETLHVLGPTIQILTPPGENDTCPCLMRGTIPPKLDVPLHAHADPETFVVVSGEVDGLTSADRDARWARVTADQIFHVPGGVKHAWRNPTSAPVEMLIMSTSKMARFFQDVGVPLRPGAVPEPPTPDELSRFQAISERYGYWNATPEENARVGISLTAV